MAAAAGSDAPRPATPARRRRRRRGPGAAGAVGWVLVGVVAAVALTAPLLAPHNPLAQDLELRAGSPTLSRGGLGAHPLGNDQLGRDILSRILYGSRISLGVGLAAVVLGGTVGVGLGVMAGYVGGWPDRLIMRVADIQLAFPFILLAMAIIAVAGPGLGKLIAVLALSGWVTYARVVRSEVLSVREREFVQAARAIGLRDGRIMLRHILPNVIAPVIVISTLELARVVILEAALSFLGLGVQPPTPSWGRMLADGRDFLATAWWISTVPGLAIMALVLGVNLVGDWLRDVLDPRIRYSS
jgi:peptide/nickel transport system permease protein